VAWGCIQRVAAALVMVAVSAGGCGTGAAGGWWRPKQRDESQRLAAAFQAAQTGKSSLTSEMVDWLDDDNIAVRYYAIQALSRQTGTDMGYHYAAPVESRRAAADRWRAYVQAAGTDATSK